MAGLPSIDQMQATAYQQDRDLQGFYNQNATNATNQYNQSRDSANQAQSQLQDFTKNMQSGTDIYAQQLGKANQNAGYDVNNLNQAQNQVSQLTGILGGLPRAIQASNANYGATAGNVANQYATTGANLNQSLQLANQNAQNQLAKQAGGLSGAQAATTAGVQTQDQQRQGYAAAAANASNIMATAQTQMDAMVKAQQNGQQLTAQDQATFGQLRAAYASAAQAYAAANLANKQAAGQDLTNQQTQNYMGSQSYQNQLRYGNPQGAQPSAPVQNATASNNASGGNPIGNAWNWLTTPNHAINDPLNWLAGKVGIH